MGLPEPFNVSDTLKKHLVEILQRHAEAPKYAEEHLKEQQVRMKEHYDKNATKNTYIVVEYKTPTTVVLKWLSDGKHLKRLSML